jgi:hypothetical protein
MWRRERIRAALIEQRPDRLQFLVLAALERAYAFEVAHIARAIDPLIGTRQRRKGQGRVKGLSDNRAGVELARKFFKCRLGIFPIVQRRLEVGHDTAGRHIAAEIGGNDDQLSVRASIAQGCQLHLVRLLVTSLRHF